MAEAVTANLSEVEVLPQLPEVVQKFLETSYSQKAIIVPLTEKRISGLDLSTGPRPFEDFNRAFMQTHPLVFNPHIRRNRIVSSYLTPEIPIDFTRSVEFVLQPSALARDSTHGVFFGILRLTQDSESPSIEVAVKPYRGENTERVYSKAWREFISSHVILHRGLPTIKPLALVFDNRNAYIISIRERLTSLDDVVWGPFRNALGILHTPGDVEQFIQTKYRHLLPANSDSGFATLDQQLSQYFVTLKNLALCLARLHLKGIYPRDSQIKNFVSEALTNQVWAIDWEDTSITFGGQAADQAGPARFESKYAYYGITQLLLSLIVQGSLHNDIQKINGLGLFDLYFSNIINQLQIQKPEIIAEMRESSSKLQSGRGKPQYSGGLLAVTDKISQDFLTLFNVLFLQHYTNEVKNHHLNPEQILGYEQGFKLKIFQHMTNILVRDVDYYLSLDGGIRPLDIT